MNWKLKSALAVSTLLLAAQAAAQVTFYENESYGGRSFTTDREVGDLYRFGFNNRASSLVVNQGRWEVCENAGYAGRCMVVSRGNYESLSGMGMSGRISSMRPADPNQRFDNDGSVPVVTQPSGQITFYENEGFGGRTFVADRAIGNFGAFGFNDRASSVAVNQGRWEVCENAGFGGRCVVLRRGNYDSLQRMGLNDRISSVRPVDPNRRYPNEAPAPLAAIPAGQITFYEGEGFRGRTFIANREVVNFGVFGFNDRASSVVVDQGRWEVCENARFGGRCVILRRGSYESLAGMGLNDRISSVRPVDPYGRFNNEAPAPMASPNYNYRRRVNESVFNVPVTSVHAVMGPPNERCWMERQQVSDGGQGGLNVPGAVIGAIIGGVLGHQVGGGRGKDIATVGGAVAGGAVGANVGRTTGVIQGGEVRRCENIDSSIPAYWDVTYDFRGTAHRIQMSAAPGATIAVNGDGEPRQ